MFNPMGWVWNLDWAWGPGWFFGFAGSIVALVIVCVPWFFFLLNLQTLLQRVDPRNRAMAAGYVWLNFIPVFNLGWFLYTVLKVRESLAAEYRTRGWQPEGDQGYNVGLVTGVLAIATFFLGWIPVLGWGAAIAQIICWILYWLKTSEIKNRLAAPGMWPYGTSTYDRQAGYDRGSAYGDQAAAHRQGADDRQAGYDRSTYGRPDATQSRPPAPRPGPGTGTGAGATSVRQPSPAAQQAQPPAQPPRTESAQPPQGQAPPVWPTPWPARDSSPGGDATTTAEGPADSSRPASAAPGESDRRQLRCAVCGTEYLPSDKFCRTCGIRLSQ